MTFAVATAGGGLAIAVLALCGRSPGAGGRRRGRRGRAGRAVLGAVLAWPLGPPPDDAGRTTTVALIQGDVPDAGLEFNARRRQVLDNHVPQTLKLADQVKSGAVPRPDLVVWPENSSDIDPYRNPDAAAADHDRRSTRSACRCSSAPIVDGPGNDHVQQRRHPVVAEVGAGRRVHQASPGAVRRIHPAARAGPDGELQGEPGVAGHDRREGQRPARRRPVPDRRRHLLRGRLRQPGPFVGAGRRAARSSYRPTTRHSVTPRRPTSSWR